MQINKGILQEKTNNISPKNNKNNKNNTNRKGDKNKNNYIIQSS